MCPSVDPTDFPNLIAGNHKDTSPLDNRYNCIAYAADVDSKWWWPDAMNRGYWPPNVTRKETLDAFIEAYGTNGYVVCSDDSVEQGFEKVAIYAKGPQQDQPTHAARQLPNGKWTSKLGKAEDIEHDTPAGVEGPGYGRAVIFMKRPTPKPAMQTPQD